MLYPGIAHIQLTNRCAHKSIHRPSTCFLSCYKKQTELNTSASTDDLTITITIIIGNDRVVCYPGVFALSSPQLHSTSEVPDLQSWSSRCGCNTHPCSLPHLIYILLLKHCTCEHTHTQHIHWQTKTCVHITACTYCTVSVHTCM